MSTSWITSAESQCVNLATKMNQNKLYMGLAVLGLFGWEHCFRLRDLAFRPTVGLNFTTDKLRIGFEFVGARVAKLSSFLTMLDFTELKKTGGDLFRSVFNLSVSWLYTFKGYCEQAHAYVGEQNLIYLGSFLLVLGMCGILGYTYKKYIKK